MLEILFSFISFVNKFKEGAYFNSKVKVMAKGVRKRAKSGCYFKISVHQEQ